MTELTDKTVTVRKDRKCAWCGEVIPKGSQARYRVYVFDGFTTDYMHPECGEAMDTHPDRRDFEYDGFDFGMFQRGGYEYE